MFKIDPRGAGKGKVVVTSRSPSNQDISTKVEERDFKYYSKLIPNEAGEWVTKVFYDNEEVKGSPYVYQVFDPSLADITGLNLNNSSYQINTKINFQGLIRLIINEVKK